uniref:NADH dehydrogenase subunit 6 n=1 Tax=Homoiodoris japonica TaxID=1663358 RepID=A0A1R7SVA8_9GAST|nr:NADH dehydrogenase subunit 6 [Homoiodoris japonica]AKK32249.1 NADH dehydrogenase subunit 6 [Homoiodoris japonica]
MALVGSLLLAHVSQSPLSSSFMGYSNWMTGDMLAESKNISILLFLAVLLVIVVVLVTHISGAKGFSVVNEKS